MKKLFYTLSGSNGASYIINTSSLKDIRESLKFYKARTFKQKVQKSLFIAYVFLFKNQLKSLEEVNKYLESLSSCKIDFHLSKTSSVLVSPTRDKVIVHHHDCFFEKFAFGKSYANVKREAEIYKLLERDFHYFEVSKMYDRVETGEYCSFKLSSIRKYIPNKQDLTLALVEFFSVTLQKDVLLKEQIESIIKTCKNHTEIVTILNTLKEEKAHATIALGLVHRDFKPWNIKDDKGLLIFDFEEAIQNGLPLEDMFNYTIDPVIRYEDTIKVVEKIFDAKMIQEYRRYLNLLEINVDFFVLLNLYLAQRVLFWEAVGEIETSKVYAALFNCINTSEFSYER